MRAVCRLLLVLSAALLGMVTVVGEAAAQEEAVEIVQEPDGAPCNPCVVHVMGESELARPDGVMLSRCQDEFSITIYSDAAGETEWSGTTHPSGGPGCNTVNCAAPESHWPITIGELASGGVHATNRFCINGIHCEVEGQVTSEISHGQEFNGHDRCPHPILPYMELVHTWQNESNDIEHLHM